MVISKKTVIYVVEIAGNRYRRLIEIFLQLSFFFLINIFLS